MQYSAINIQGNIISSEILEKIRIEDIRYQTQADFGLDKNTSVRDEIGIAWAAARAHWSAFSLRRERLKEKDTGTSETRQGWMIPFLRELGYDLEKSKAEIINGKSYAISHRAANRDGFPVHIIGINQSLDKRAETGGTRLSPHALIQEYLNNHEHLYALTTNGKYLRLLRDATRLSRLSFLEFDLERIMEEELYAEFALLYRVLHISRMPENQDAGEVSIIEFYHQEALSSGSRIREKLSIAVEESLKLLANGILKHPKNTAFREKVSEAELTPDQYYLYLLRLVYRILFLMVIEERNLIYPDKREDDLNRKRKIYYQYYSINRLTKLTAKQIYIDPDKTDLWKSLLVTFRLFENEFYGEKLGIKPLSSGLFAEDALGSLKGQVLNNGILLKVLNMLVSFENENKQRVHVNYADLDVEEFGSVYEGLLEYDAAFREVNGQTTFTFIKGDDRSSSGSHYTPEELVKPLIKHSLDYLIQDCIEKPEERLGLKDAPKSPLQGRQRGVLQEKALLSLKVADVACGSGHILLSAARRIAHELAIVRTGEDQPTPPAMRQATRDVIRNCIYGVDLNPLAVELCKVALWLEAHNPNEPLNFLDHRIKCGNAIVGLAHFEELENGIADEAFKTLPGDDKDTAAKLRNTNKKERKDKAQLKTYDLSKVDENLKGIQKDFQNFKELPEHTPKEIEAKEKAYRKLTSGSRWMRLKQLADMQIAQFFIPKTPENETKFVTDGVYRNYLNTGSQITGQAPAKASAIAAQKRFFHYFLEFPEVFAHGGFDCILGNPPYLGGSKLSGSYSYNFLNYLRLEYKPAKGLSDLVTFFIRRIYILLTELSYFSIITTNTISQGDTREGGLDVIVNDKGTIIFAIKSLKWPGTASLQVTLISVFKGLFNRKKYLENKNVNSINTLLTDEDFFGEPHKLKANENISFNGSSILGKGFIIDKENANKLLLNEKNKKVVRPLLNGSELNKFSKLLPERFVINFYDWDISKAKQFPDCFDIVEKEVFPERQKQNDKGAKEKWWQFLRPRMELYSKIGKLNYCIANALTSKTVQFRMVPTKYVYSHAIGLFATDSFSFFGVLQSSFHTQWAWKYGSTMKADLRYTSSDVFENFAFPKGFSNDEKLINLSYELHKKREELLEMANIGTTFFFNFYNNDKINELALKKHFTTKAECENFLQGLIIYRGYLKDLDQYVLTIYSWHKDSEKWGPAIDLAHDFYEVDYLPENDNIRFTISPEARKEVLKRLLLLNHERYEEEIKQGLHKKKDVEKFYADKGIPVPEGIEFSDGKKKKKAKAKPAKKTYKIKDDVELVKEDALPVSMFGNEKAEDGCMVTLSDMNKQTIKILLSNDHQSTEEYEAVNHMSGWYGTLYGREINERIKYMGKDYDIVGIERFLGGDLTMTKSLLWKF